MQKIQNILTIVAIVLMGALVSWAGGSTGVTIDIVGAKTISVFVLGAALMFIIQCVAFIPAYLKKTEHFYDLVGGLSYVTLIVLTLTLLPHWDLRTILLAGMVSVWALRLSLFLFVRVKQAGSDSRFDSIKLDPLRYLIAWTGQGLWIVVTAGCALAAMTSSLQVVLSYLDLLAISMWLLGFTIEIVADWQKRQFKRTPNPATPFICTGLWRYSRHPNYFGEIILWTGIALLSLPALAGWQHVTLISPLFVMVLLSKVSGVPLLEAKADERWQHLHSYQQYKQSTPVLVPKLK